jgi:peptide/nickel transport system permease protein
VLVNTKIAGFIGRKILRLISLLIVVCFVSFMLIQFSPIDPVRAYIGEMPVSAEHKAKLEAYWGVNTPPQEKFLNWAGDVLKGNFGTSLIIECLLPM